MYRFNFNDFRNIERTPMSPSYLQNKICDLVACSVYTKVKVDSVNPDTGEYRIVLHGTLDWDHPETWWTNR
ncbi:MAG: hypothetical protein JSV10_10065 [Candidatus Zixiibacteriota bacterium]|jgi:hypothetical protein|nr:MAG: hypothetical protein JSV10_10065 [candidate division Zixibacteria bacterium]